MIKTTVFKVIVSSQQYSNHFYVMNVYLLSNVLIYRFKVELEKIYK